LTTAIPCLVLTGPAMAQEAAQEAVPQTTMLDTIIVTANRAEEQKREVTSNVTVIDADEIKASTAQNLAQLMQQKGFPVINQGTQKILKIRGMGQRSMATEMTSEILVLLNGRRIGANNVALMGLANIERVEIIRGPSAVQYGPSAMGGVVNIITKRGSEDRETALEVGGGSFRYNKQSLSSSGAFNGFDYSVGVTRTARNDYKIKNGKTWRNTSFDSFLTSNIDFGYNFLDTHRLGINFNYYGQNNARSPGDGWSGTGAIGNHDDYNQMDLRNHNLALNYEGATSDNVFKWNARYSFGKDVTNADYFSSSWGNSWADNVLDNQSSAAQITYDNQFIALTAGFDHVMYDYRQKGSYTNETSRYRDIGLYLSGKVRLLDERLILSAAARYDNFKVSAHSMDDETSDSNFSPSIGFAFLPTEWLKVRGHYAEGFRMPGPDEITGGWRTLANYSLEPEKSKTLEFGADINWNFFTFEMTYFHTKWDDKIIGIAVDPVNFQNQNLEGATIAGLELMLKADIARAMGQEFSFSPYISLNHLTQRKNKDKDMIELANSTVIPNVPETTVSFGISFDHPGYGLKANIMASYFSEILTRDWRANSPTYYEYINHKSSTVVDASIEKIIFEDKKWGSLSLRGEANNIFDSHNEFYLDYPEAGRNYAVSLKYNIKY